MSFLAMDEEEYNFIWKTICELQLIFHPRYSREGEVDFKALSVLKNRKRIIIMLDRNLLSSLIRLSCDGYLKNEEEMRIIALLMIWLSINNYPASAGLALQECATKINNNIGAKLEL